MTMKVLLVNGSPRATGNTARALKEVADTLAAEGMQTMRTLARNMAWVVKNLRRPDAAPRPADEPWQPANFIR